MRNDRYTAKCLRFTPYVLRILLTQCQSNFPDPRSLNQAEIRPIFLISNFYFLISHSSDLSV
jgi:hypothetical protein